MTGAKKSREGRLLNSFYLRFAVIVVIAVAYALAWLWLSSHSRGFPDLHPLDQLLCPFTFISCMGSQGEGGSWLRLLVFNAIAFVIWMLFLVAGRGFIYGKTRARQGLGLAISLLIPGAVLAVFVLGLALSIIR